MAIIKHLRTVHDFLTSIDNEEIFLIEPDNSVDDIINYLLNNHDTTPEEIINIILDNVNELQRDEKIKLLTKIHSQLINVVSFE